jgi:hypothetical protein
VPAGIAGVFVDRHAGRLGSPPAADQGTGGVQAIPVS